MQFSPNTATQQSAIITVNAPGEDVHYTGTATINVYDDEDVVLASTQTTFHYISGDTTATALFTFDAATSTALAYSLSERTGTWRAKLQSGEIIAYGTAVSSITRQPEIYIPTPADNCVPAAEPNFNTGAYVGPPGKSAYQLALDNGFEGTEEEWLASLNDEAVGTRSYVHTQAVASDTWVVQHNLGFYPNVTVIDSVGRTIVIPVVYDSPNQVTIQLSSAIGGQAICS